MEKRARPKDMTSHDIGSPNDTGPGRRWFQTTNWGLVRDAAAADPDRAKRAMEWLCSRYWYPVYAYIHSDIRRSGNAASDAEDLTQGFFEFAIEQGLIQKARHERGRFRNFILTSLNNYLRNWQDRISALKRGGSVQILSLDMCNAERLLANEPEEPNGAASPAFDRRWAATLINRAMENLRAEFTKRDKQVLHDTLLPFLTLNPTAADYERMAADLLMEQGTVRVSCFRFRRRFGEILRREVAQTVTDPDDVEDEIRYLLSVLADF